MKDAIAFLDELDSKGELLKWFVVNVGLIDVAVGLYIYRYWNMLGY